MQAMKWVEGVMSQMRRVRRIAVGAAMLVLPAGAATAAGAAEDASPLVRMAPAAQVDALDALDEQDRPGQPGRPGRTGQRSGGLLQPLSIYGGEQTRVPGVAGGQFRLPDLIAPTTDTENIGDGTTPEGFRGDEPAPRRPLPESLADRGLAGDWTLRTWAAPNTFANPRYFEDRMLERHGHERFGHLQPLASGVRFFATVPALPYLSTVRPPWECEYTLGYYRAGSCAPPLLQRPPYERRAALVEAASVAGAILIFP